jgi:hypothetical protein
MCDRPGAEVLRVMSGLVVRTEQRVREALCRLLRIPVDSFETAGRRVSVAKLDRLLKERMSFF